MSLRPRYVVMVLLMAVALAACKGSEPDASGGTPTASSPSPIATEDCGDVSAAVVAHLAASTVDEVTVVGQCTTVVIATNLSDDDTTTALDLCDRAAEVAYTGDINAISVHAKSGAELAGGITDLPCLP